MPFLLRRRRVCTSLNWHRRPAAAHGFDITTTRRGELSLGYNWYFCTDSGSLVNTLYRTLGSFSNPSKAVCFADTLNGPTADGYRGYEFQMATRMCNVLEAISTRHNGGANLAFADGHVASHKLGQINARTNLSLWGPW
ncbi:MAG: hypothetical protein GX595_12540 [Lentisphaerae bacterium]|nr:hypothetical protein [Lentisphaerota bacterium]